MKKQNMMRALSVKIIIFALKENVPSKLSKLFETAFNQNIAWRIQTKISAGKFLGLSWEW